MTESTIRVRPPFDFAATAQFLRRTEGEAVDTFRRGRYARALHLGDDLHLLKVESRGTRSRPALAFTLAPRAGAPGRESERAARSVVRQIFSVDHDLEKLRAHVRRDPLMRRLEAAHRGLRLARWPTLFESLVVSILSQQISTAVAMTLKRRLVERFGERLEWDGETFFAFPRAAAVARAGMEDLRALGLSNAKAAAVIELARAAERGALDADEVEREENESVIARLSSLRGVGRWTAEWALILYFGRTDVFPAGDLALRGVVTKYYNNGRPLGSEREVRTFAGERWGEWSSYAALYFLAGLRAGRVTIRPRGVISSEMAGKRLPLPRRPAGDQEDDSTDT